MLEGRQVTRGVRFCIAVLLLLGAMAYPAHSPARPPARALLFLLCLLSPLSPPARRARRARHVTLRPARPARAFRTNQAQGYISIKTGKQSFPV